MSKRKSKAGDESYVASRPDELGMSLEEQLDKITQEGFVKQSSELGEVMKNLDNDDVDEKTRMSAIDFNTRLTAFEIPAILTIDELQSIGVFPSTSNLTRQFKRLKVSEGGKGREEKVRVVSSERERQSGGGFLGKIGGLFQRG